MTDGQCGGLIRDQRYIRIATWCAGIRRENQDLEVAIAVRRGGENATNDLAGSGEENARVRARASACAAVDYNSRRWRPEADANVQGAWPATVSSEFPVLPAPAITTHRLRHSTSAMVEVATVR